jgi:dipeptidyl aminopeptidase/acylaminoacyl peptidase
MLKGKKGRVSMQKFEERESVELFNNDQKLFGVMHRPLNKEKVPAVLICHGLAGHKVGKHRMYVGLSECLAKLGIASLRIDFRGSGDSEGPFSEMTYSTEVNDAVLALNFLSNHPQVDKERIGILGRSFGGAVAIKASETFKKVKSIALWASIFDVSQWEKSWEMISTGKVDEAQRHELMRIDGQLPGMEFYKELFSLDLTKHHESLLSTPMLHIHGEKDPVVSLDHADKFASLRKKATAQTQFLRLPHSDHDFSHPEEKVTAIDTTCSWFNKTL